MKRKGIARLLALALTGTMVMGTLTGCTFGFASDPDDPNEVEEEIPIDTSVDTYEYRTDLKGTEISVLNTKAEIQVALEEIAVIKPGSRQALRDPCKYAYRGYNDLP